MAEFQHCYLWSELHWLCGRPTAYKTCGPIFAFWMCHILCNFFQLYTYDKVFPKNFQVLNFPYVVKNIGKRDVFDDISALQGEN